MIFPDQHAPTPPRKLTHPNDPARYEIVSWLRRLHQRTLNAHRQAGRHYVEELPARWQYLRLALANPTNHTARLQVRIAFSR